MVLDVKALNWASRNGIDSAKLKAAKVPIYGKWYFPEIPANVTVVNLDTGEQQKFAKEMLAGEVSWVAVRDLQKAGLGDIEAAPVDDDVPIVHDHTESADANPLIAMSRLPGGDYMVAPAYAPVLLAAEEELGPQPTPAGMHMPLASMAPLMLAMGICIALIGLVTHVIVLVVGLLWVIAGVAGWIRIGLLESSAGHPEHA